MLRKLYRWAWLPGLLCGFALVAGCNNEGDLDDDGVNEAIEEESASPPGVPSTGLGEAASPADENPSSDVRPDHPGQAPEVKIDAPPYQPGEVRPDANAPGGAEVVGQPDTTAPDATPDAGAGEPPGSGDKPDSADAPAGPADATPDARVGDEPADPSPDASKPDEGGSE
jgi:hypothetical protein